MERKSLPAAILRTAITHRKKWIIEQGVLMVIALIATAIFESSWGVLIVLGIYAAAALLFGGYRAWKELEATFKSQQREIEVLRSNAESHKSDLAEAERRQQFIYRNRFRRAEDDFRMAALSNQGAVVRLENELSMRNADVSQLTDENRHLRHELERLREQISNDMPD